MARIPEQEVERLKREVSLLRLIEGQGHVLVRQGKDLACRCPWHEGDATPSCLVTEKSNLWHCFGCDAGGSVIDWVMRSHKVSFRHACELLLKEHPALAAVNTDPSSVRMPTPLTGVASETTPLPQSKLRMAASPFSLAADEQILLDQVIGFYHETLKQSPEALAYLEKRGCGSMELVERFQLGFANRTLSYQLAPKQIKAGAELRGALQKIGILRASGHEHFNGSLVIPIFAHHAERATQTVLGVYGRKVTRDTKLTRGTPLHLYLPGAHRGVFNREGIEGQEEVILCESLIDALTFWHAGYRNVTSSYGVNGFTADLLEAFKTCGCRRVLIAYDRDEAGDRAAEVLATQLQQAGFDCFRLLFPKGLDANAYALQVQPASKSLGVVIRSAQPLYVVRSALCEKDHERQTGIPRATGMAERDRTGAESLCGDTGVAQARDVCVSGSDSQSGDQHPGEYCRGPGTPASERVLTVPEHSERQLGGTAHSADRGAKAQLPESGTVGCAGGSDERSSSTPGWPDESITQLIAHNIERTTHDALSDEQAALALNTHNVERTTHNDLPPLAAAAVPPASSDDPASVTERQVEMMFGERRYRVRGHTKNTSYEVMKVNVLVAVGDAMHVDTVDLYAAKYRQVFARQAASELRVEEAVINRDLGKLLLKLEQLQDARIEDALKPQSPTLPAMSEAEHAAALAFLHDPDLIAQIGADFERTGLVGEAANTLVGYLACVSRKLAAPLALIIQSTSAAGKSALMDAVLALVPEEDRVHYSAMTGQSLFYLGETSVKHKILAIAEEEGVRQAAYALKVLQSQGELTIASTGKDPQTGMLVTQEYRVEGPVMLFLTTTAIDIDEELLNRCLVLTINESREQTRAIQQRQRQRRTLTGLLAKAEADEVLALHRNAQRLLRSLAVVNPYAEQLTFLDDRTRLRRDHQKYLTLIEAIALLHQYQRPVRSLHRCSKAIEYIEVELSDIALANRLAHEVLGRSLDELPPQTRRLLGELDHLVAARATQQAMARADVRLTRKEIRDASGVSDTRLRLHLDRLVDMEYLFAHSGRQGRRFVYELAFEGRIDSDAPQMIGLLDVAKLEALQAGGTTATSPGREAYFAPSSPAVHLSPAPHSPGLTNGLQANANAASSESHSLNGQNARFPENLRVGSRSASSSLLNALL